MRLVKLTLQGFKSFADKAVLEFPPGITGIVGPNGCGKSNVVDAIRWVMGEQSPKSLRGTEMKELLFGGSERRSPTGRAKVDMLFERDDLEAGPTEVEISRRLYRSGESHYSLNRTRCRLKDITDLLMDAGLYGAESAIVEQGKIDRILSLKPHERIRVFEEAAGVRIFHVQRKRSEAKLERTLQNLDRLGDIIEEVESQERRLARQARLARRYRGLSGELSSLKHRLYSIRRQGHEERRQLLDRKISVTAEARERARERLRETRDELARLEPQIGEAKREYRQQFDRSHKLELKLNETVTELQILTASKPDAEGQRKNAEAEVRRLCDSLALLGRQTEEVQREKAETFARLEAAEEELTVAQTEQEQLQRELADLAGTAEEARQSLIVHHGDHASATGEKRRLAESLLRDRNRGEALRGEAAGLEDQLKELEAKLERQQREADDRNEALEHLRFEIEDLEGQRLGIRENRAGERQKLELLRRRQEALQATLATLHRLQKNLEGVSHGPRKILEWAGQEQTAGGRFFLLADFLSLPRELEAAVIAALGPMTEALVAPCLESAFKVVDLFGDTLGPTTFCVVDPLPHLESPQPRKTRFLRGNGSKFELLADLLPGKEKISQLVRAVLGRCFVAQNREQALRFLEAACEGDRVVTLQGELFWRGRAFTTGSQRSEAGQRVTRNVEIQKLEGDLLEIDEREESLILRAQELDDSLRRLESALQDLEVLGKRHEREGQEAALELARGRAEADQLRLEADTRLQESLNLRRQLEAQSTELELLAGRCRQAEAEIARWERRCQQIDKELQKQRTALREFEEAELHAKNLEARALRERIRAHAARETELAYRAEQARKDLERRRRGSVEARERLRRVEKRIVDLRDLERELKGDHRSMEVRLGDGAAQLEELQGRATSLRHELAELADAEQETSRELAGFQIELADCKGALARLEELVAGLSPGPVESIDITGAPTEEESPEALESTIVEVERKMRGLGQLNFAAIEEHDVCGKRLEFLRSQQADLESSVADLREAIASLAKRADETFRAAFDEIADTFSRLFEELLPGGQARIFLRDREPGVRGIEIEARPPGKKLRSLALLSGGEKALVTLVLLVAMIFRRPGSICVLDEVDAPLDEINNARFLELLRTLARRTQVLVVTHSKKTIEGCDTLFGITMDEPGVSGIVSVRLWHGASRQV